MLSWGYVYWDRIAVLWERAANHAGMTHPEMVNSARILSSKIKNARPDREPDFAFERTQGDVALMEAKGSFVNPAKDNPSTKNDLRQGLQQLRAWSGMVAPTPQKSFVIGSFFRDVSDDNGDPSLITFVDPPGEAAINSRPIDFPDDWIRRGNYGAWLVGMGYPDGGEALRWARRSTSVERNILTVDIAGRSFAFEIEGVRIKSNGRPLWRPWQFPPFLLEDLIYSGRFNDAQILRHFGIAAIQVIGIEASVLRLIEEANEKPGSQALMRREAERDQGIAVESTKSIDGFAGSIFPDGTLYGQFSPEFLAEARIETFRI
jgi:hypothetical protein